MKKEMMELKNKLNDILNEWDPLHVVEDGVHDEYSSYAGRLLSILINEKADRKIINAYINQILDEMGLEQVDGEAEQISNKIISWWKTQSNMRE